MMFPNEFRNHNMISWAINRVCNFRCDYCTQWQNAKIDKLQQIDLINLDNSFKKLGKDWIIHISGGEPFLEKDIIDICKIVSKRHYLSLSTNLTSDKIYEFAEKINPERVLFISAAVHISEREKRNVCLEAYTQKVKFLQSKGFNVIACYVAHPTLFSKVLIDIEFLKSRGIQKVHIKIFHGIHENRYYSDSFNNGDKHIPEGLESGYPEHEILNGRHHYRSKLCNPGQGFFRMDREGNLIMCSSLKKPYGNLFDKDFTFTTQPTPCPILCGYPYECIRNIIPSEATNLGLLKEVVFEKTLLIKKILKAPNVINKIKEETIEFLAQNRFGGPRSN